jgi:hypothetical protein
MNRMREGSEKVSEKGRRRKESMEKDINGQFV